MRIRSNRLQDLINFYYSELKDLYDRAEIDSLLAASAHHYLGYSRTDLVTRKNENLNQSDVLKMYDCAKALRSGQPLQYILGTVYFYDTLIGVNPDVLIPRPETEELCDIIVKENPYACNILDICTGSGCIPVALKKHLPRANVTACDISSAALKTAEKNALLNQTVVYFFNADVLETKVLPVQNKFDLIVSNPPYILENEKGTMSEQVTKYEPHLALFATGGDPVIFYKKIIDLCNKHLSNAGLLYFELNPITAEQVLQYAERSGLFYETNIFKDMSGKLRFFKAIKKST
jgi:release factor glutamine methyltransferase